MLYMIIERFKNQAPLPVYKRFFDNGRLAPHGLIYVSSWVDTNFHICFQIMQTDDPNLINIWISHWSDIVVLKSFLFSLSGCFWTYFPSSYS